VGLRFQRVPKEHQDVDKPLGNSCAKLLIAAKWARSKSFYREAGVLGNQSSCGARASISSFMLSWATSAMRFVAGLSISIMMVVVMTQVCQVFGMGYIRFDEEQQNNS
jgi:hypothetical protein